MNEPSLEAALTRAERAIARIERATAANRVAGQREAQLRDKVQGVVAELDQMIRTAGGR